MSHRKRYKAIHYNIAQRQNDLVHVLAGFMVGVSYMFFIASVFQTLGARFPF